MNYLFSLIAGLILPLAFAPYGIWLLSYISLIIFISVLNKSTSRQAFWLGLFYGIGSLSIGASWIVDGIYNYSQMILPVLIASTVLFILYFALFAAFWAYSYRKFFSLNQLNTLLAFPITGVFWEYLRSIIFPWLMYGNSQIDSPIRSLATLVGVYGLSLVTLLISAALYLYTQKIKLLNSLTLSMILLLTLLSNNLDCVIPGSKKYSVALLQTNLEPAERIELITKPEEIWKFYASDIEKNIDKNIIILPEYAIYQHNKKFITFINNIAQKHGSTIVLGVGVDDDAHYNTLMLAGNNHDVYYKHLLVPFGEYLPFAKILAPFFEKAGLPYGVTKARDLAQLVTINELAITPAICFEITFADFIRQSIAQYNTHVIINISEDYWFGKSWGSLQHFEIARMRALENGVYILRVATSGVTAIIDYHGKVIAQAPQFTKSSVNGEFYELHGSTPWSRLGRWPLFSVMLIILCFLKSKDFGSINVKTRS